jgi:hypothetical protein
MCALRTASSPKAEIIIRSSSSDTRVGASVPMQWLISSRARLSGIRSVAIARPRC